MEQFTVPSVKGLYTHPNPIGEVPPGALINAVNVNIQRDGTVETRRGFTDTVSGVGGSYPMGIYPQYPIAYVYQKNGNMYYTTISGSALTAIGTDATGFTPPSSLHCPIFAEAGGNSYFTTAVGVKRVERIGYTPFFGGRAGAPKGLDGTAVTSGASGFMANNTAVAYRVCFAYVDAQATKIVGSPTSRILATNTSGGTRTVDVTFTLPSEITTSHYYQIYRSVQTANSTDEPLDEMQLVVEKQPTSGEVSALSVTYTDQTPDNVLGATLYTSPSQQGILQSNERPPYAISLAFYKNMMFYANTAIPQRMFMTVIAVGGSSGLAVNDTIVIDGVTYTGKAAETAASGQFLISTTGTTAQNIDATARSLVRVINKYASNTTVYAYYLSGYQDLPGKIMIEHRAAYNATAFVATSSRTTAFSPPIPTSGVTYKSANETKKNRIYISKPQQQEAVPLLNYIDIGPSNTEIVNVLALRECLIVLKEDGIYRITGETFSDLRTTLLDGTTNIVFPHCCVPYDNKIFAISTQGAVMVGDAGVEILSRPIEREFLYAVSTVLKGSLSPRNCFAIPYQHDGKIIINFARDENDAPVNWNKVYVYSPITQAWTTWDISMTCGAIMAGYSVMDSTSYFGLSVERIIIGTFYWGKDGLLHRTIRFENKTIGLSDYSDESYSVNVTGVSGNTLTTDFSAPANISDGCVLTQGLYNWVLYKRSGTIYFVPRSSSPVSPSVTSATLLFPISSVITFSPLHCNTPGIWKKFISFDVFLGATCDNTVYAYFSTDTYGATAATPPEEFVDRSVQGYPLIEGVIENGVVKKFLPTKAIGTPIDTNQKDFQPVKIQNGRVFVPYEKARARSMIVSLYSSQALTRMDINGFVVNYAKTGTRANGSVSVLAV